MDIYDIKLLNLLQRNNKLTTDRLGELIDLSTSAVQRRIRSLRERKIIEADVSIIAPEHVGLSLMAVVLVTFERDQVQLVEEFKRHMIAADEVLHCYYVTGVADMIVTLCIEDIRAYHEFARKYFSSNSNVRQFTTSFVLKRVKTSTAVPIPERLADPRE